MTGSRFRLSPHIIGLIAVLALACTGPAWADPDAGSIAASTAAIVGTEASDAAGIVAAQSTTTAVESAFSAASSAFQDIITTVEWPIQWADGLANSSSNMATAAGNVGVAATVGDAINQNHVNTVKGNAIAEQQIKYKAPDLAVAVCPQATLAAGLKGAAGGVAKILTPSPICSTNVTSVAQNVNSGILQSDCNVEFNPTKSLSQQVQEVGKDINTYFCDPNSNASGCSGASPYPHSDTNVISFFKDRTFTQADAQGFAQFEKYVCGLNDENTPKSTSYYNTAAGQAQLANQHADAGRRSLCLQAYNEFYANRYPTVDANTNAAISAVYSASTVTSTSTGVSPISGTTSMSREDLLHALFQGIVEGTDGSGANIFSQIAGLEALPTLKMIASELLLSNYMAYEQYQKSQETNMYLSIMAKQSLGSGLH